MKGKLSYRKFSFGYTFDDNKQVISLIFINYFFCLVFTVIVTLFYLLDDPIIPVTYRYHGILLMAIINLVLIRFRQVKIARINLLIVFPFLFMILPHLVGLRQDEFYFWFPYMPIGLSLIAHFILHPEKERTILIFFLSIYFFTGLFIDNLMIVLSDRELAVIPIVEANSFYYNFIPATLYVFVNLGIGLIIRQNNIYEKRLQEESIRLEETNKKLSLQKQTLLEKNNDLDQTLKQLYETRDKLVQSEKLAALGTLTAGIAHEINNPLNFIAVSLQEMTSLINEHPDLLDNKAKASQKKHYLELVSYAEEGVERVTSIVKKLGSLKSRKKDIDQRIEVIALIHASLEEIKDSVPPEINITIDIPRRLAVTCNSIDIQHVVQTIIANAIDAIGEKEIKQDEEIAITAYSETIRNLEYTTISIANTGPLIPATDIDKLFDPFFTTRSQGERTGMGLSVSFNTIQQHKGILAVENRANRVVFLVSLPQKSS